MSTGPKRPLAQVLAIAEEMVRVLAPFCRRIEIAGSIRRQAREASDIDLVAIPIIDMVERPIPGDLFHQREIVQVNRLWEGLDLMLSGHYVQGGERSRWFIAPNETIQVQVSTCEEGNWGNILLIRTGPWQYSKRVVTALLKARRPSYDAWVRLAPDIGPTDWTEAELSAMPKVQTPTEEKIFQLARLPHLLPHQRSE